MVTINYRLNVFGFLCHPEITAESPEAPANFGHLDQQAATRWVKRNIAAFGGDPDNITIGGQSAGGGSVMSQLTSPQNEGLFQRAIIQSGVFTKLYPGSPHAQVSARSGGSRTGRREILRISRRILACGSSEAGCGLSPRQDAGVQGDSGAPSSTIKFSVGNAFELFLQNKRWQVPVMFGHTSSEFFSVPEADTLDEFKSMAVELIRRRCR